MRRVVLLALVALLVPISAWAGGINLVNEKGVIYLSESGLTTTGSLLMQYNNIQAAQGHALGHVYFATGALDSGSLWGGGTFSSTGSSFEVTSLGLQHMPKGVLFDGAFVGEITWQLTSQTGKNNFVFDLIGNIAGTDWTGHTVYGTTDQTIIAYKNQWLKDGKGSVHYGTTHLIIPEPGTLGLLGTGLVAIAGAIRRKMA